MGCGRAAPRHRIPRSVFIGNFGSSIYFWIGTEADDFLYGSSRLGFCHHSFRVFARRLRAKPSRTYHLTADRPIACGVCCKDIDDFGHVAHEQAFGDRECRKCLVFSNSFVESCRHFKADRVLSSARKPLLEHVMLHRMPAGNRHHHGIRIN